MTGLTQLVESRVNGGRLRRSRRAAVMPQKRRRGWAITPWLFLVLPLGFLLVFTYIPVMNMLWYSVTDWDGLSKTKEFVGLANYGTFFSRPALFRVFFVSLYYIGASVLQMALALYFATVLTFSTRFKSLFKGILFFPYLINGVAIAFVFLYFFQPGGTLDSLLGMIGMDGTKPQWLGNPDIVNFSLAGTSIWKVTDVRTGAALGEFQVTGSQDLLKQ